LSSKTSAGETKVTLTVDWTEVDLISDLSTLCDDNQGDRGEN